MVSFLLSHFSIFRSEENCPDENRSEPQPSEEKKELKVQEGMRKPVKNYNANSSPEASFMSHKIYQERGKLKESSGVCVGSDYCVI